MAEPVADVAVTLSGHHTFCGEAFAMGERSPLALINPAAAARMTVAETLTNLVAADIGAGPGCTVCQLDGRGRKRR